MGNPYCASTRSSRSYQPRIQIHGCLKLLCKCIQQWMLATYLKRKTIRSVWGQRNLMSDAPFVHTNLYLGDRMTFKHTISLSVTKNWFRVCFTSVFSTGSVFFLWFFVLIFIS